jgi:hypothetical protein
LALRFTCGNLKAFGTDGVVAVTGQVFDGAPFTVEVLKASHYEGVPICDEGTLSELERKDIIAKILKNGIAHDTEFVTTHRDVVFYDDYKCEGKEVGAFNALYDVDIVTFGEDAGAYEQSDATGFIRLNALRLRIAARRGRNR